MRCRLLVLAAALAVLAGCRGGSRATPRDHPVAYAVDRDELARLGDQDESEALDDADVGAAAAASRPRAGSANSLH